MIVHYFKDFDDVWYAEFTIDDVEFDPVNVLIFSLGPKDYEAKVSIEGKAHVNLGSLEVNSLFELIQEAHKVLLILEQEQC